jgi:hypothetical protein
MAAKQPEGTPRLAHSELPLHFVHPPIHYARSGDLKIAYQVTGDGPIDLVWTPGTVSQLDMEWDWPPRARVLEGFAAFCRADQRVRGGGRGAGFEHG